MDTTLQLNQEEIKFGLPQSPTHQQAPIQVLTEASIVGADYTP